MTIRHAFCTAATLALLPISACRALAQRPPEQHALGARVDALATPEAAAGRLSGGRCARETFGSPSKESRLRGAAGSPISDSEPALSRGGVSKQGLVSLGSQGTNAGHSPRSAQAALNPGFHSDCDSI